MGWMARWVAWTWSLKGRFVQLSSEGQPRAQLSAQGSQPGTPGYDYGTPMEARGPRRRPIDVRTLLPEALEHLDAEAWNYVGWFQGLPYAYYSRVGHAGDLPPIHGMSSLPRLREKRQRVLAKALQRRRFDLSGYCLLLCQARCGWACSRPVSVDGRGSHTNHECPDCHQDE